MDWLKAEILRGFQRLLTLGLPHTPDATLVKGPTANVWLDALTARLDFDQQRDTPRIEAAFRQLVLTSTEWPKPAQFLTEFARTAPEQPRLGKDRRIPATRDARLRHLSELLGDQFNPQVIHRER